MANGDFVSKGGIRRFAAIMVGPVSRADSPLGKHVKMDRTSLFQENPPDSGWPRKKREKHGRTRFISILPVSGLALEQNTRLISNWQL